MTDQPYPAAPHDQPQTTAPPTPPARGGSHVGLIIGSIVGGVLLLGLTFGGGAVVGWAIATHHVGHVASASHQTMTGPQGRDDVRERPEQRQNRHGQTPRHPNGNPNPNETPSTPTPAPTL
ncbi:hypothetical protein [Microbacterium rhizomatis]|uniref:Uncharacterized protein n=1 Tax=Microbacterium rhizomatis TaxID=1631477 RepID=A0A5J5J900_9MICO|nr:hypothetical protein [Microbacterium rhizomatis]KAA9111495.1 hypothetical protein F6B43_07995 [Microbacterium rhizomatis]